MVSDLTAPVAALFVPGSRPDRFAKAAGSGADAIILELEDAVAAPAKVTARQCVVAWKGVPACRTFVRINGRRSPWFADDLSGLGSSSPDAVVLPKTESAEDSAHTRAALLNARSELVWRVDFCRDAIDRTRLSRCSGAISP